MIRQTILAFKVEMTRDLITPHAGLALLGEFAVGLGLSDSVDRYLPKPGSGAGYNPSEYTFPLILISLRLINAQWWWSLEDTRQIRTDEGLREILPLVSCQSRNVISTAGRNLRFLSREDSFEMTEYR